MCAFHLEIISVSFGGIWRIYLKIKMMKHICEISVTTATAVTKQPLDVYTSLQFHMRCTHVDTSTKKLT